LRVAKSAVSHNFLHIFSPFFSISYDVYDIFSMYLQTAEKWKRTQPKGFLEPWIYILMTKKCYPQK